MMAFISHNLILSLGILLLVVLFLCGKIVGLLLRGFVVVLLVLIAVGVLTGLYQRGASGFRAHYSDNTVAQAEGQFNHFRDKIFNGLSGSGQNMQTGYRSCLNDAFQHEKSGKNGDTIVAGLKRQCPNASPVNQDSEWEACVTGTLNKYDPSTVASCQSKYHGPVLTTKLTAFHSQFCGWFPSLCSISK